MPRIHLSACKELSKEVTYLPNMAADYLFKPNGLWYAMDDDWLEWVQTERVESFTNYTSKFALDIDSDKVCVLDNVRKVLEFHGKYSYKYKYGFSAIHWEEVKRQYSGIEIRDYEVLNMESAFRGIIWMRNWAMDSGCIWDLSAVDWKKF